MTQKDGTEPAFRNECWDNKAEGICVYIVSGEPLFSSVDKFDSGTGRPGFTRPLVADNITKRQDRSFFMVRTEVRGKQGAGAGPGPAVYRGVLPACAADFVVK